MEIPDEVLVDARGLPPPEPLERVMDALGALHPGQTIRLLLHREPFPLYDLLAGRGYAHATHEDAEGNYVILIRSSHDPTAPRARE